MKRINRRYNKTSIYESLRLLINSIVINAFKWQNTPIEDNQLWILENLLYNYGSCIIIKEGGYFVLPLSDLGKQDQNGILIKAKPIAYNGVDFPIYTVRGEGQNAVLVYNNLFRTPTISLIRPIIERLNYAWESIGIAEANSRIKNIIKVDDPNQKDVILNTIDYITDNKNPAIITYSDNLNGTGGGSKLGGVVDTSDLINIWKDFNMTKSLLLEWLGIESNPEVDKKERMITDEIESNSQLTLMIRNTALNFRKQAIKECQRVFGDEWKNAKVDFQLKLDEQEELNKFMNLNNQNQNNNDLQNKDKDI